MGIAIMVSVLSAKQSSYLATAADKLTDATAVGSSLVFTIGLGLAVVNVVLSLFMKKPDLSGEKSTVKSAAGLEAGR
jgi:DHA2 family lincomycin resistance protein-like MFS transporter